MANDWEKLEQLSAYVDGESSESERAEVERLVEADPQARRLLHELRTTARLVGGLERVTAPPGFADAVQARLERRALLGDSPSGLEQGRAPAGRWVRRFAVAACFALVCTAAWYGWRTEPGPGRQESKYVLTDNAETASPVGGEKLAFSDAKSEREFNLDSATVGADEMRQKEIQAQQPVAVEEARRHLTALGYVTTDAEEQAKPSDSADGRAGMDDDEAGFEKRLALGVVTNSAIRGASAETFANQLDVQTSDPADVSKIVAGIELQMNDFAIPNVAAEDLPEPIAPTQAFYAVQKPDDAQRMRAALTEEDSSTAEEVQIVMNVPTEVAVQAVQALQQSVDPRRVAVVWKAGGLEGRFGTYRYLDAPWPPSWLPDTTRGYVQPPGAAPATAADAASAAGSGRIRGRSQGKDSKEPDAGPGAVVESTSRRNEAGASSGNETLRRSGERAPTAGNEPGKLAQAEATAKKSEATPEKQPQSRPSTVEGNAGGEPPAADGDKPMGPPDANKQAPVLVRQFVGTPRDRATAGQGIDRADRNARAADAVGQHAPVAGQSNFITLALTLRAMKDGPAQTVGGRATQGQSPTSPENPATTTQAAKPLAPTVATQPTSQGAGGG